MKKYLNISVILLILYYCLERFTYYSIGMYLPIYFATKLGLSDTSSDLYHNLTRYLPFLSLILSAILIDRVRIFRNLKLYFIPIILGILFCMIGTYTAIIIGTSIFILSSSLIQINIFLKIFVQLKKANPIDDRVFLVLYLAFNLFSGLAPILTGTLRTDMSIFMAYTLPNIVLWILFGLLFIWKYSDSDDEEPSELEATNIKLPSRTLKVILASFIGFLFYYHLSAQFFQTQNNFNDSQDFNFKLELIPFIVIYVVGIIFLFLSKVQYVGKIIITLTATIATGIIIIFNPFNSENIDTYTLIINSINSATGILIYPAIITLVLVYTRLELRGTFLSIFFLLTYTINYINSGLIKIDSTIMILISELALFGLLYLTLRYERLAAHNMRS